MGEPLMRHRRESPSSNRIVPADTDHQAAAGAPIGSDVPPRWASA